MNDILARFLLWMLSSFILIFFPEFENPTAYVLFGFIYSSLGIFINYRYFNLVSVSILMVLSFFLPGIGVYMPVAAYQILFRRMLFSKSCFFECVIIFSSFIYQNLPFSFVTVLYYPVLCILSCFVASSLYRQELLEITLIHTRDDNVEKQELMKNKYETLRERQDNELRMAALYERNRIAREIHDNVGHTLSRSILQLGALMAIHKETEFEMQLRPLKESLDEAMNNIRTSVHDLHKNSIDFSTSLQHLTDEMTDYQVIVHNDIEDELPQDIAYCFLAILKEAFTNIQKHSDATEVIITASDLSNYYQLIIEDNGTSVHQNQELSSGIGLKNMENRIQEQNGLIYFSSQKGFRIFISVPKNKGEKL